MQKYDQNVALDDFDQDGILEVGKNLMDSRYSIVDSSLYRDAVDALPQTSTLRQNADVGEFPSTETLFQEAMMAMNDWSLLFLDRIFELLRSASEQEKQKGYGIGASYAAVDVAQAKNMSRILKETLTYFFASMDEETYTTSLRYVTNFMSEETLPFAVKDASMLCQAVASTRFGQDRSSTGDVSPGLDALVPILCGDLQHRSNKSAIYRLRCLGGAVRYAGRTVLKHREAIVSAITYAIKSDDKHLLKAGSKSESTSSILPLGSLISS